MLIATKIRVPQIRRRIVPRDRLVERLSRGLDGPLVVVSAPAGWGKSTLVLEWLRSLRGAVRVAWVSLEPADADPARFWAYVVHALARTLPSELAEAVRLVDGGRVDVEDVLIPSLVNQVEDAVDGPVVLVLDDYHAVSSERVDRQVGHLVNHLPRALHVVLVTRWRPALALGRLRARGELCELRETDLRFTPSETRALLTDVLGLRLAGEEIAALHRSTEGWAVALHLAALSLRGRRGPVRSLPRLGAADGHLVEYLVAEVLGRLSPDLRAFLMHTSALERMTTSLCRAVTGRPDAGEMLAQAEAENLFLIPLDDQREWFRYHHLFAAVLRERLAEEDPERLLVLHRRASEWYAAAGFAPEAVQHALEAGDLALAHRLVDASWNHEYNIGRLATVSGWLDALGAERIRADPWLSAARVMIWADEGRLEELDAWLEEDAERTVDGYPYAVLRALHRFKSGDLAGASRELDAAARLRSQSQPFWPTVERCVDGAVAYWSGDAARARTDFAAAATLARSYDNVAAQTYALGYLALLAVDEGDTAAADGRLAQTAAHVDARSDLASHFVLALPHLAAGRLAAARSGSAAGLGHLEAAVHSARRGAGRLEKVAALDAAGRAFVRDGRRQEGEALLGEATALLRSWPDPGRAGVLLADLPRAPRPRPPTDGVPLTPREWALLELLPTSLSLREIAGELYISYNTAKTHSRTLYRKLSAATRADAVEAARAAGLLTAAPERPPSRTTAARPGVPGGEAP